MEFVIILAWSVCAGLIGWYCVNLAREITYVTLPDGRKQARALPLSFKLLLPLAGNFKQVVCSPSLAKARKRADDRLITAGFEGLLSGWEFLALRILFPIVFGALWAAFMAVMASVSPVVRDEFGFLVILGIVLFTLKPGLWLSQTIKIRQKSIIRAMPFVIDLLTLSVEAGVDFMSALQRAIERRKMDPLTEELIRVNHEIQLGTSRREALRNLAKRCDLADMRSFAFALIQADELGVSIGAMLRIQADQIRQKRFDRAEKLANEAPVKMLGPLLLFIFPAVFIVLLGPILSRVAGSL